MTFHQNRLLADDAHEISPYFCRKLGKMSQNLSSAAVAIGALRVKNEFGPQKVLYILGMQLIFAASFALILKKQSTEEKRHP